MYLHSDGLRLTIHEEAGLALIDLVVDSERSVPIRQGVELGIGFIHHSLDQLMGGRWRPQRIGFTHSPPARTDAHRRFFGTSVEFGQDCNRIVCLLSDIAAVVPASDPTMAHHVQQYIDTLTPRPSATVYDNVRDFIYMTLASGLCSADRAARHLGVNRRTLHRQLAREGETFSSVIDGVRVELAVRYIGDRRRSLAAVAELLGFSALSAFSRWFRGRFGLTVSEWRAASSQASKDRASPPSKVLRQQPGPFSITIDRADGSRGTD
jgi:AraC-like DNA-binding protein